MATVCQLCHPRHRSAFPGAELGAERAPREAKADGGHFGGQPHRAQDPQLLPCPVTQGPQANLTPTQQHLLSQANLVLHPVLSSAQVTKGLIWPPKK